MRLPISVSGPMHLLLLALVFGSALVQGQAQERMRLYLLPGTGADHRLFHPLDLSGFDTVNVTLPVAQWGESMSHYAARVAATQIDTTAPFALVGVSLGGMVATELAAQLQPEHVLIIASAKTREELPVGYRFARYLPLYRLVGGRTMRWFTKLVRKRPSNHVS